MRGVAREIEVRRADQREVVLVGDGEDDAAVLILEDVGLAVVEQPAHDDVAALHEPHARGGVRRDAARHHGGHERTAGIDEGARLCGLPAARDRVAQLDQPSVADPARRGDLGTHADIGPARGGVHGVEHHEARVVHPAVGVLEAAREARLQRLALGRTPQVDGRRRRQADACAEVVVEEEAEPDEEGGPQAAVVREHEAQRLDDVGRHAEEHLALGEGLAHEAELVLLEVAQPAVDELGRGRRRSARQVVLLGEQHAEPASRGVPRDTAAVDAPTDDGNVVRHGRRSDATGSMT